MSGILKILLLEDSVADAELISWELKRAHLNHELNRVQTREDFLGALESYDPDLVLSDHTMPGYDGLAALKDMRRQRPGTPFIFVSGTLGEDRAVDSLKRGASDYVVKGDLMRLPSAIERAIKEKRLRSERETALRELKASEAIFKTLAEQAPVGILLADTQNRPTFCNEQMAEISGRSTDELIGMDFMELIHPDDREHAATIAKILAERKPGEVEYRIIRPSGETRWITGRGVGRFSPEGAPLGFIGVLMDTTEAKAAEEKILRLVRIQEVLSGINSAIVRVNDRHRLCHDACKIAVEKGGFRVAGIILVKPGSEEVVAQGFYGMDPDFSAYLNGLAITSAGTVSLNVKHALLSAKTLIANSLDQLPNATSHAERLQRANVKAVAFLPLKVGNDVQGLIVLGSESREFFVGEELKLLNELSEDIAFAVDHIDKEERLNYLAYHDSLTGLPNRALFLKQLREEVQKAGNEGRNFALAIFNIERFRNINESFGEQQGDALLQAAAHRLSSRHKEGYFGRLGGDSFGCIVTRADDKADITQRLERGLDAWLAEPFQVANQDIVISFRLGVAIFPDAATDADTLFQNANAALKQAKNSGERLAFYNQDTNRRVAERTHYETRLRNAIEQKQFVLYYQPKINLETGRIGSLEALMRWQDPERGLIPPGDFIPMLEETGLIYEVGMIALQQAFDAHVELRKHFTFAPYIAVNVSALQLQRKTFCQDMLRMIDKANGNDHGIDIEITESLIMHDIEANIVKLKEVRDQNVHIAIDDFGTGYSSLSYIAKLPIDVLKIDRSFIERMTESGEARAIVSAIISLAHSLDLTVVAEGVETREQMTELKILKCDEAQGYLFCRPIPLGELIGRMVEQEGIVVLRS